jgi:hypothetical protein
VGCVRHLAVRHTVRVLAKSLVFEAVDVGGVVEGGVWEDGVEIG